MPKSRKTKAKYKDFQKVKLKIGKKLPKADNVTDASFKSRSINIKDQLKTAHTSGEPTTRRKQDLHDLLSHCQHHNVTMRHDAVTGLREIITDDQRVLRTHLAALLERVPDLCIDRDGAVRRAVNRFFKAALPHIPEHQMAPFFSVLSAHLCCAMTHIDDEIQLDSLQLFDLYMEHYPHLLVNSNNSLLTNFIEQISRKSSSGAPGAGRTLLVNPNSKLSSRKGRVQVLDRLHRFLKAVIEEKQHTSSTEVGNSRAEFIFDDGRAAFHQPIGSMWTNVYLMHKLQNGSKSVTGAGMDLLQSGKKLGALLDVLLPLMLQCWIEVGPGQMSTDLPGNVMTRDSLSTLGSILKVIHLLLQCAQSCDSETESAVMKTLQESYLNDFVQHYLPCFPYAMHDRPVSDKKKAPKSEPTVSVLSLNLTVCEIMSYFAESATGQVPPKWLKKLITFSVQCTKQPLDLDQLQSLLRFIGKLLEVNLDQEKQEQLMNCVCALFTTRHRLSRDRLLLLDFLSHHVTASKSDHFLRMPSVQNWLSSLPRILIQSCGQNDDVTRKLIHIIRQMTPLNQKPLLEALQRDCMDLIEALSRVDSEAQSLLVEVLYWVPAWTRRHLQALAQTTHQTGVQPAHVHKLLLGLMYRYQRDRENMEEHLVFEHADFFSFVLAVISGMSKDEMEKFSSGEQNDLLTESGILETWATRMQYTEVMVSLLLQLPNTNQIISLLGTAINVIFEKYTRLPLAAVVSLLGLVTRLHQPQSAIILSQPPAVVSAMVTAATGTVTAAAEAGPAPAHGALRWEDVRDTTLGTCAHLLASSPDTVISFVGELLSKMADCTEQNTVFSHVYVITRLQRDSKLRPAMIGHCHHVRTVITQLQEKMPELEAQVWWSDLKYEISLMQPKQI